MATLISHVDFNMTANSQRITLHIDPELLIVMFRFVGSFEAVFGDIDWEMTRDIINSDSLEHYIHPNGTFIEPCVDDESNNWGNRGSLLSTYRDLKHRMTAIEPIIHAICKQRNAHNKTQAQVTEAKDVCKVESDERGDL